MKRIALALAVVMILTVASVAYAAQPFDKTITFVDKSTYGSIVSDTTSKNKYVSDEDYARLYITNNTSKVNSVFRTYYNNSYVSNPYFKRVTTGTWMYYTSDVPANKYVTLRGRPDSSLSSCTVTGEFGAG